MNDLYVEDKAFLPSYDLAPPPLLSRSPVVSKLDRRHRGRLRKNDYFMTGKGEGEEPNHTTARKPGPLKIHSIIAVKAVS